MAKKIVAMLLVLAMVFSFAACGGNDAGTSSGSASASADVIDDVSGSTASKATKKNKKDKKTTSKTTSNATGSTTSDKKNAATQGKVNKTTGTTSMGSNKNSSKKSVTVHAANNVNVKSGASISQNVNIKGKTIVMAVTAGEGQYHTGSFTRTIKAFEKKYGCKVKTINLDFDNYNKQVSQKIAAKASPDIAYIHGSMFPACAVDGLYENLLPSLRSDDLMDNNNPLDGGIDLNKSSYFAFGGKLYGTCNYSSVFPYIIYYNKKMFNDEGISDPRKLASKGNWDWSRIEKLGKKYSKPSDDKYFLASSFITGRLITLTYGAPIVKVENGKYKQNVDSREYIAACSYIWQLGYSSRPIAAPVSVGSHGYDEWDYFIKGGCYMFSQESSKYVEIVQEAMSANAFGKSKSNLGVVEVPLATKYNKNRYPTGWLTAVACGKGKNPKVAIAWDVFRSSYKDPQTDKNGFSATDKAYVDALLKGDIACEPGAFQDASKQTNLIVANDLQPAVRKAGSTSAIQSIVNRYKNQIQSCIDNTIKKG